MTNASLLAQEDTALRENESLPLDVLLLGDRILVRGALKTSVFNKATHVIVDYSSPWAIQINSSVVSSIQFAEGEATLKVDLGSIVLEIDRRAIVSDSSGITSSITARYDSELGQVDVAAVLGWPALNDRTLRLDLQENSLSLLPATRTPADAARKYSWVFDGVQTVGNSVFVPIHPNPGKMSYLKFGTGGYHSLINMKFAAEAAESESPLQVFLGSENELDMAGMAALWPLDFVAKEHADYLESLSNESAAVKRAAEQGLAREDLPLDLFAVQPDVPPGRYLVQSGLSMWIGFQLELNPTAGYLALTPTLESSYSEADAAFYAAANDESAGAALAKFLDSHPDDRNVEEAVSLAFGDLLDQGAAVPEILVILDCGLRVTQERRRFSYMFGFMQPLFSDEAQRMKHSDLIVGIGTRALDFISTSQNPRLRQQVQLMLGDRYLASGGADQAWRMFLAAAFNGDPRLDGQVRYDLGRVYEAQGRVRRAYSSYTRSLSEFVQLPPDLQDEAKRALDRLRPQLDPDDELLQSVAGDG